MEAGALPPDLADGNADDFSVSIESILLSNGFRVETPKTGVTVIVGGNNVGKSTFLRQSSEYLRRGVGQARNIDRWRLVSEVEVDIAGSVRDCAAWLVENHGLYYRSGLVHFGGSGPVNEHSVRLMYQFRGQEPDTFSDLFDLFALFGDPWQRVGFVQPQEMRDNIDSPALTPIHRVEDSLELLEEIKGICREVFRQELTLDSMAKMIQLRVGAVDLKAPPADAVTREYRMSVASLPPLNEQGEGMKSLIGLLLPLISALRPIVFIDEPEAFLHPPQANALGRILGRIAKEKKIQVVLATHDKNLLTGILASSVDTTVVRLDRSQGGESTAHQLAVDEIRELWSDPLLKYTNVLDSLFHRLTVIGESDRDCRFYSAALGEHEPVSEIPIPATDVLFVPAYGKSAMHKLAGALRSIHVPTVVIPDIDILNDEANISRLVSAVGGDWGLLRHSYDIATAQFRGQRGTPVTVGHVVAAVNSVFAGRESEPFDAKAKAELSVQLRIQESPWAELKKYGELAFRGQSAPAAQELIGALDDLGIVLVTVGELEGFAPSLPVAKGPAWLSAALASGAHRERPAREHILRCVALLDRDPGRRANLPR
ncbi:ATP-binding protein [Streptomyces sp. NBC_00669]|uniref:ATP-dependent nuclease n=1 Tax=Streptomyces sp. NBC_00669 TaxID=2976011 RepID=UPI002E331D88|nr:ATP-binding protein [Streptomyces sp. NBC_00669]